MPRAAKKGSSDASDLSESDFEVEPKISLKRKTVADSKTKKIKKTPSKPTKGKTSNSKSDNKKSKNKAKKSKVKDEDEGEEENADSDEEALVMPGQKVKTPPDGDASRIFYVTLYKQNPNSKIAEKYLLENGLLDKDRAKEVLKKLEKEKAKKK